MIPPKTPATAEKKIVNNISTKNGPRRSRTLNKSRPTSGKNAASTLLPSRGGMGTKLNTAKLILIMLNSAKN